MSGKRMLLGVVVLLAAANFSQADDGKSIPADYLADNGIEVGIGVTNVYQQNVRGGISKHRRAGRFQGSYDLEISTDLEKLLGIEGGRVFMLTEGVWSKSAGIDGPSVGSAFGVNGDARNRRSMDITEFWYQQSFLDDKLQIRVGKIDFTGGFECRGCPVSFDGSAYANDEHTQFLNNAFINNPTIPFPDYGLAMIVHCNPVDWWYISGGLADAQADIRETGFSTTFHKEDYFLYMLETGVTPRPGSATGPLQGAYRVGLWYDPQPKANTDGSKNYRDDVGVYLSCDQMLVKENSDPEDGQGLGAFFRYGYAGSKRNDIVNFWSVGFQYQGPLEGRDEDVLGLGFAQGIFSNSADTTYTEDYENALELYYSAALTPWLNISPSIQYIANPGGNQAVSDAVVLGLRVQMSF